MKKTLEPFIKNPDLITRALEKTSKEYRPLDPGWYLYRQVCQEMDLSRRFNDEFIELVYVTLAAWNMNSRGAKLANWDEFRSSVLAFRESFQRLESFELNKVGEDVLANLLDKYVRVMFVQMELVYPGKPRLVTYSKAFHFFLPKLFVPIDRKYTLTYFYGNDMVPDSLERQFKRFSELHQEFRRFASSVPLEHVLDDSWNGNIPKVIDNIIIGHQR